jgi:hypothetical protein
VSSLTATDWFITVAIVALVLWAAHRAGQANPVGTGKLARRMDMLELKVAEQGQKLDAQGVQIAAVERAVVAVADAAGETNKSIAAIRLELAGDRGLTERTWGAVDRLQHFFIADAFAARKDRG